MPWRLCLTTHKLGNLQCTSYRFFFVHVTLPVDASLDVLHFAMGDRKNRDNISDPLSFPIQSCVEKAHVLLLIVVVAGMGGGGGGQQHKNRDNSDNVSDHLSFLEHSAIPLHLRVERPGVLALARQVPTGLDALEAGEQDLLVVLLVTLLQPRGELLVDLGPLVLKVTQSCSLKWSTDNKQHSNVHWSTLSTTAEKVLFKVSNNQMLCF